jgi:hypothetical protein
MRETRGKTVKEQRNAVHLLADYQPQGKVRTDKFGLKIRKWKTYENLAF